MDKEKKFDGTAVQIAISSICVATGAVLIFVPQVRLDIMCYVFCIVLILAGAFAILRFFMKEGYKEIQNYGFSLGFFLILLGCSGLIRADKVIGGITGYMGMISMVLGIVILQGMVQLKALKNPVWVVELVLAIVSLVSSFLTLLDIDAINNTIENFGCLVLMIVGILSLMSLFLVWIGLKRYNKKNEKAEDVTRQEITDEQTVG